MLEITEFTEARLASVTNRTEKHGDEDVPAVTLAVEITTANTILDGICPGLRHALYKAVEGQEQLPGIELSTPVLRSNVIEKVQLTTAHEGWRLQVDDGIDDTDPMAFEGVKVDKLKVDAKQGGSITLGVRLGTSDVDSERLGKLAMHNGQSIWIKLLKPEPKPEGATEATGAEIDGTVGHPGAAGASAEDLFAAGEAGGEDGAETGETRADAGESPGAEDDAQGQSGAAIDESDSTSGFAAADEGGSEQPTDSERGENWPFPTGQASGAVCDSAQVGKSEQEELEAGMSQSIAAAGVAPKGRRGRRAGVVVE